MCKIAHPGDQIIAPSQRQSTHAAGWFVTTGTANAMTRLQQPQLPFILTGPVVPRKALREVRNAPGLNSGAAAMVVAERDWAEKQGLAPMARLVSYGIGAVEPGMFGLGPVPAVRQALARAGWRIGDIERIEINEAFAAIAVAVTRELGLDEDIVNVEGGAVAHGHPIGATGAVLTTRLLHSMARDSIKRGVVTLCIGGGQGIALTLQALH